MSTSYTRLTRKSALISGFFNLPFGAIATTETRTSLRSDFTFSGGAMHFGGPSRKGNLLAGGFKYTSGVNRFQADVAVSQLDGVNPGFTQASGNDVAINLAGSYRLMATTHT